MEKRGDDASSRARSGLPLRDGRAPDVDAGAVLPRLAARGAADRDVDLRRILPIIRGLPVRFE